MKLNIISDDQGNMFMELPDELVDELEWSIGDTLVWELHDDTTVTLRKKDEGQV